MPDDDDIRDLLAFARADQEPPLRLDPTEIVQQGRRLVRRRRRLAIAGNTVAVVALSALITVSIVVRHTGHTDRVQPVVSPVITTLSPTPRPPAVTPPSTVLPTPDSLARPPLPGRTISPGIQPSPSG